MHLYIDKTTKTYGDASDLMTVDTQQFYWIDWDEFLQSASDNEVLILFRALCQMNKENS